MGGGEKIVFGREKKIVRKQIQLLHALHVYKLVWLSSIFACVNMHTYAWLIMIIGHMKLYEPISINMYLCGGARVWLQKKIHTNTYEHICMYRYIATCVCVCARARGIEASLRWLIHDMRTRVLPPHWLLLTYAVVCWHMLTYADICWRMLTYA